MRNRDKPWFDVHCRHAFGLKQQAHLRWNCDLSRINWEEFVRCPVRAIETYSEANRQFSVRNRARLLISAWWSTLKSAVFCLISSLPPLVGGGGGLMCESVCPRIILTACSAGSLLICRSLAIRLTDLPPLSSGRVMSDVSCLTWALMGTLTHWVCFLFFLRELQIFWPSS